MAQQVQFRRGSTADHSTFTGAVGEVTVDTDKDTAVVHDGSTAGGFPLVKEAAIGVSVQAYDADTAKTDVTQVFTAGQRGEVTSVSSSSGTLTIDFNASNNFSCTLSENISTVAISNATAGQSGSIFLAQPGSGGPYTVGGWNAAFKFSGGTAPTITATNSKTDRIDYVILNSSNIQVVWTGNY